MGMVCTPFATSYTRRPKECLFLPLAHSDGPPIEKPDGTGTRSNRKSPKSPSHFPLAWYSSSVTSSCQSVFPWLIARWNIIVPSSPPCQCVVPASHQTESPTPSRLGSPPLSHIQPEPASTRRNWPFSCVCQYVRAPGVNITWLMLIVGPAPSAYTGL